MARSRFNITGNGDSPWAPGGSPDSGGETTSMRGQAINVRVLRPVPVVTVHTQQEHPARGQQRARSCLIQHLRVEQWLLPAVVIAIPFPCQRGRTACIVLNVSSTAGKANPNGGEQPLLDT